MRLAWTTRLAILAAALCLLPSYGASAKISRDAAKVECVTKARQFEPPRTRISRNVEGRHATQIYRACMRQLGHRP